MRVTGIDHYYGVVPALGWLLGHYFYDREHFAYLAYEYYPYRLPNPKSSNPHRIYQDLYEPWRDRDEYDKYIAQVRVNLRNGVMAQAARRPWWGIGWVRQLKRICQRVDIAFYYPLVIRVDSKAIAAHRMVKAGSALTAGSHECLVRDLSSHEFDVVFADDDTDADVMRWVVSEIHAGSPQRGRPVSQQVLSALLARCQ